jgi:serine O-acetyltransferase
MTRDPDWSADLARLGGRRSILSEPALCALWVYRFGRRVDRGREGPVKRLKTRFYWFFFHIVEIVTGISLPKECFIGPGLRIWHFGGIFVHPNAVIGKNCTLRQGVTIGNTGYDERAPTIGDNVDLGAYAQIIGAVNIGPDCKIGALTAVLTDIPSGATVVGQSARIIQKTCKSQNGDD